MFCVNIKLKRGGSRFDLSVFYAGIQKFRLQALLLLGLRAKVTLLKKQ